MNDDNDTDAGGDFFFDLMKTLAAFVIFIFALLVMGAIVSGVITWFS